MMHTTGHGEALRRRFRLDNIPTLLSGLGTDNCVTFSRIRCDLPEHGLTSQTPAEDAYSVQTVLRSMPGLEVMLGGRRSTVRSVDVGSLFLFDLQTPPTVHFHDPIDSLRVYLPATALHETANEIGLRHFKRLAVPELGAEDRMTHALSAAMAPALAGTHNPSQLFVDHMAGAMAMHLLATYGPRTPTTLTGGLAAWQLRRATDFLRHHLAGDPCLDRLAAECSLSRTQFSRLFKASTGVAPYQWLLEERIAVARRMLRDTREPLATIAAACGFRSHSRFSKSFRHRVGMSPGAYRRSR